METRAGHALIGLFTLAALAVLVGFSYWYGSGRSVGKMDVRIIFTDEVTGLGRGSSVLFNGLRVGEVTQIDMQPDNPRQIYAVIRVEQSTPLRVDTRARLEAQGLAGVVAVQLLGGDPNSAVLAPQAGQALPTIIAEHSDDILETVRNVAQRVDEALDGIEGLVKGNASQIGGTIRNAEQFTAALAETSNGIDTFMRNVGTAADAIAPFPDRLGTFSAELTDAIRSLDQKYVASLVANVERVTSTLGGASGDVGKAVKDVASVANRLNRAADQVDGVLRGAQVFLAKAVGQDGRSAFSDVSDIAKSLRVLADNLDQRMAAITAEISRFTNAGLRSIETLTTDGRRTLTGFGRTIREVERDPQRLFFGGKPQLPPYNGSR